MKYGTDRETAVLLFSMSAETETAPTGTETKTERKTFVEDTDTILTVPVLTGIAVMMFGSLFIVTTSPEPGSLTFGAVASTMIGVVVGGFVCISAFLVASILAPFFGGTPEHEAILEEEGQEGNGK